MVASIPRPTSSHMKSNSVLRTSSDSSVGSSANGCNIAETRRTRKRISAIQLAHLEELYRRASHPTRDERDALAKRIEMETRSVTVWFQNKRQTDRKVALHNATNSRNISPPSSASPTLFTMPIPAVHPLGADVQMLHGESAHKPTNEGITRKQSGTYPTNTKRAPSFSSSVASTSTSSTSKTRPSLDRIASRSEVRFTRRPSPVRRCGNGSIAMHYTSNVIDDSHGCMNSNTKRTATHSPASPPNCPSPPLWATMLSSPLAPSSPPPVEYVAYMRTRKARTLDWACASARLAPGARCIGLESHEGFTFDPPKSIMSNSDDTLLTSGNNLTSKRLHGTANQSILHPPAAPIHHCQITATVYEGILNPSGGETDCIREYEEGTIMTEDEVELVTPHGSQDTSIPWTKNQEKWTGLQATCMEAGPAIVDGAEDSAGACINGWAEDEMHAALALCGLRG